MRAVAALNHYNDGITETLWAELAFGGLHIHLQVVVFVFCRCIVIVTGVIIIVFFNVTTGSFLGV